MLCVRRWSDAGRPAGRVSCWQVQYNAESPKQDIKRFNSVTKTDPLCPSRYIFICGVWQLAIMLSDRFHKKIKIKSILSVLLYRYLIVFFPIWPIAGYNSAQSGVFLHILTH